jgi:deferrochelatase/peroxidase EfeB
MAAPAVSVDLGDIQGDILRAYGNDYDCTTYAFVRIDCPPEQAQAWFAGVADHVTTAQPWRPGEKPLTTLNVAVTAAGLGALGVPEQVVGSFSKEFRQGMAGRNEVLGDVGPSDPASWEPGLGGDDAHVLLTINAKQPSDHQRALGKMRAAMDAAGGVRIVHQEDTGMLAGAREHFGYADGFAQPAIEGSSDDKAPGGGVPVHNGARSRRASSSSGIPTRTRSSIPSAGSRTRLPPRSGAAGRTWSGASSIRTSRCGDASCATRPRSTRMATRAS